MSAARKTVRVFVSSTFRDMHAERDHLVTVVFPELRERLEALGLDFFDVDLRWGVPRAGSDGERANSWAYCKKWIERTEPFFLALLGQRYGWVPPPEEIADPDDRRRYAGLSITEMEVRHAALGGRLRRRSFFYFRAAPVPAETPPEVYHEFVDEREQLRLEALKEEVCRSGQRVRRYPARWTGAGFDQLDDFGRMVLEELWSDVLRDPAYVPPDAWREALGHDPRDDPLYTGAAGPVPRALWERVVEQARPRPADPLDAETDQMAAFAEGRLRWFQGRGQELARLRQFVEEDAAPEDRLCVVGAVPGQGKSALLARLVQQLAGSPHFVLAHFVGATERSADARSLLERINAELDRHGLARSPAAAGTQDLESLRLRLEQRLADHAGRRIVLVLDALNQLTAGHDLAWLPRRPGPSVRLVVSCAADPAAPPQGADARTLAALRERRPVWVDLRPLEEGDVRQVVIDYLSEYCKELDREQIDTLCGMEQARNPLYLLVMLGELRTLGGNDLNRLVPELIARMRERHPDTVSLFDWVLERLEVFGAEAVRLWCGYLAAGRAGMASRELRDLLARRLGPEAARTAPLIERGLRRYLQRRGPLLDFFHGQLREAVTRRYGVEGGRGFHADIADYFDGLWELPDARALAELPYHRIEARDPAGLRRLVRDRFFAARAEHLGDIDALLDARAVAVALAAAGDDYWDDLLACARAHCAIAERLRGDPGSVEALVCRGDVARVLAAVETETDPDRRDILGLAASVLLAEAGHAAAAGPLRTRAVAALRLDWRRPAILSQLTRVVLDRLDPAGASEPTRDPPPPEEGPAPAGVTPRTTVPATEQVLAQLTGNDMTFFLLPVLAVSALLGWWVAAVAPLPATVPWSFRLLLGVLVALWAGMGCYGAYDWYRRALRRSGNVAGTLAGLLLAASQVPSGEQRRLLLLALRHRGMLRGAGVVLLRAEDFGPALDIQLRAARAAGDLSALLRALSVADKECAAVLVRLLRQLDPQELAALRGAGGSLPFWLLAGTADLAPEPELLGRCSDLGNDPGARLQRAATATLARALLAGLRLQKRWRNWKEEFQADLGNAVRGLWRRLLGVRLDLGLVKGLLWALVMLPAGAGVFLFFLGLAVFVLPLGVVMILVGQTHDVYGLAPDAWQDGKELERRLDQAALYPIPLLAAFDGRHFRAPVLARMILTGQLGGGAGRFAPVEVRSVVWRLARQRLLGRRADLVLAALGDGGVIEAAATLPAAPDRARPARAVGPAEHDRQLARTLPLTRGRNLLLTGTLAAVGTGLWAIALHRFSPDSPWTWALTTGLILAGVFTLLQPVGGRGAGGGLSNTVMLKGGGLVQLVVLGCFVLWCWLPVWNLAFWATTLSALAITNLLAPEFIARWRGAGLLYPTWARLWRRRLFVVALAAVGCVGLAWVAALLL
jgi:hypothetical protein